jgi:hypothetical protein
MEAEMAAIQRFMREGGNLDDLGPGRVSGIRSSLQDLRAAREQPDRGLSAPLLPGDRGQSSSAPRPVPPARIRLVQATWGGNCRQTEGNETNRLSQACNGRAQCVFTVAARGEGEAADACARDYQMVWTCGGDPRMHAYTLPPVGGQSREVTLVCPE